VAPRTFSVPGRRRLNLQPIKPRWNCPKYITPRYTVDEVEALMAPLKQRIADLELQLKQGPEGEP